MSTSSVPATAAAAEARIKASSMSVAELRSALASKGVETRGAVEKNDLVLLYVKSALNESVGSQPSAAKATTSNSPNTHRSSSSSSSWSLPKDINWSNAFLVFLFALYGG